MTTTATNSALRAQVFAKVAEIAGICVEELRDDTTLDSLGMDSSDAVILAMEVEETAGREIDVGIFLRFPTIGAAAAEIERLAAEESP